MAITANHDSEVIQLSLFAVWFVAWFGSWAIWYFKRASESTDRVEQEADLLDDNEQRTTFQSIVIALGIIYEFYGFSAIAFIESIPWAAGKGFGTYLPHTGSTGTYALGLWIAIVAIISIALFLYFFKGRVWAFRNYFGIFFFDAFGFVSAQITILMCQCAPDDHHAPPFSNAAESANFVLDDHPDMVWVVTRIPDQTCFEGVHIFYFTYSIILLMGLFLGCLQWSWSKNDFGSTVYYIPFSLFYTCIKFTLVFVEAIYHHFPLFLLLVLVVFMASGLVVVFITQPTLGVPWVNNLLAAGFAVALWCGIWGLVVLNVFDNTVLWPLIVVYSGIIPVGGLTALVNHQRTGTFSIGEQDIVVGLCSDDIATKKRYENILLSMYHGNRRNDVIRSATPQQFVQLLRSEREEIQRLSASIIRALSIENGPDFFKDVHKALRATAEPLLHSTNGNVRAELVFAFSKLDLLGKLDLINISECTIAIEEIIRALADTAVTSKELVVLDCSKTRLQSCDAFPAFSKVESLLLQGTGLNPSAYQSLAAMASLGYLDLSFSNTVPVLSPFVGTPTLSRLDISSVKRRMDISPLAQLKSLQCLNVSYSSLDLDELIACVVCLKKLRLLECAGLDLNDHQITTISQNLPALVVLDIANCGGITTQGFKSLYGTKLASVNVTATRMPLECAKTLVEACSELRYFIFVNTEIARNEAEASRLQEILFRRQQTALDSPLPLLFSSYRMSVYAGYKQEMEKYIQKSSSLRQLTEDVDKADKMIKAQVELVKTNLDKQAKARKKAKERRMAKREKARAARNQVVPVGEQSDDDEDGDYEDDDEHDPSLFKSNVVAPAQTQAELQDRIANLRAQMARVNADKQAAAATPKAVEKSATGGPLPTPMISVGQITVSNNNNTTTNNSSSSPASATHPLSISDLNNSNCNGSYSSGSATQLISPNNTANALVYQAIAPSSPSSSAVSNSDFPRPASSSASAPPRTSSNPGGLGALLPTTSQLSNASDRSAAGSSQAPRRLSGNLVVAVEGSPVVRSSSEGAPVSPSHPHAPRTISSEAMLQPRTTSFVSITGEPMLSSTDNSPRSRPGSRMNGTAAEHEQSSDNDNAQPVHRLIDTLGIPSGEREPHQRRSVKVTHQVNEDGSEEIVEEVVTAARRKKSHRKSANIHQERRLSVMELGHFNVSMLDP